MATVNSTLVLNDRMTSTFERVEKAARSAEKTFQEISKKLEDMDNKSKKVSSSTGSIFKGMLGANLVSKGISMVVGQLDKAISRFDTVNNYTNVMSGLGFGAEESQGSIDRLKDGLDGLPTTLDDAVSSVQRFAAVNENIGASTEMTLALNDALAAGGTPAATQAAALEQISQAYAKGKFDAMEYKAMMTAMPAQLKQVVQAMGYTSTAVGGDFYQALQTGKIGMNDMMKTMVELDNTTDGFHDQALKATNGIGTAFINMKTAITKGLETMIKNINSALKSSGLPEIQTIIKNIGLAIRDTISFIGTVVGNIIQFLAPVINWVINNADLVITAIVSVVAAITIYNAVMSIYTFVMSGAAAATWAVLWPILLIAAVVLLVIGLIWAMVEAVNSITGSSLSAIGVITATFTLAVAIIWNTFLALVDFLLACINFIVNPWISFANFFANIFNDPIGSIIHAFGDMADRILGILEGIANAIDSVFGSNLSAAVGGWRAGLSSKVDALANTLGNGTYEKKFEEWNLSAESLGLKRWDYGDAVYSGYQFGAGFGKGGSKKSSFDPTPIDWNSVTAPAGSGGAGGSGGSGKALKTTSTDKNLLSDDDIQLLLDVATRDYKLNYQQVTPNITLTFGDIRETANVDEVLDKVADRLEEIYDGNLEVS